MRDKSSSGDSPNTFWNKCDVRQNNYYPFGLKHKGYNNVINGTDHPYGFGGKEEQDELGLGWIDITARNYDAALGRWMNLDPLAEQMRRHSPYNYAFNNPIYWFDPDGMAPQDDYGLDTNTGALYLIKNTDSDTDTIYAGTFDENGEFIKDGQSKTFSKQSSNIREVAVGENEDQYDEKIEPEDSMEISEKGIVFNEGFLQIGLEVLEFISTSIEIELEGWGYMNEKGEGLAISSWINNTSTSAVNYQDSTSHNVTDYKGNKLGTKTGNVHTHPSRRMGLGHGNASPDDKHARNSGVDKQYPHFIIDNSGGWHKY